jgi:hypothetical protein
MKTGQTVFLFTAVALTTLVASAQSVSVPNENSPRQAVAHCADTPTDDSCARPGGMDQDGQDQGQQDQSRQDQGRKDNEAVDLRVAQGQFPPYGPRSLHPYGPPAFSYAPYDSGRHAALGAVIGFGAGFALGAGTGQNPNTRVGRGLLAGALGAVFGAAIGHAVAAFPHSSFHHRHRWSDDGNWAHAARSPQRSPGSLHVGN